jgi:hypothetical protein
MNQQELEDIHIEKYKLDAKYGRNILEKGGGSIFIHENLTFTNINLECY